MQFNDEVSDVAEDWGRDSPGWGRRIAHWIGLLLILAVAALGVGLIVKGLYLDSAPTSAPMPSKVFSESDADTYSGQKTAFVPSIKGPRIVIDSLELEAPLTQSGAKDGWLVLPDPPLATWYEKTAVIGAKQGRSLIASHVDFGQGDAAPFSQLHKIEKGAPIDVRTADGKTHEYKASSIQVYERQELPSDLFRMTGRHQLVLVTCSGPTVNSGKASYYLYNLVVIADPVPAAKK